MLKSKLRASVASVILHIEIDCFLTFNSFMNVSVLHSYLTSHNLGLSSMDYWDKLRTHLSGFPLESGYPSGTVALGAN